MTDLALSFLRILIAVYMVALASRITAEFAARSQYYATSIFGSFMTIGTALFFGKPVHAAGAVMTGQIIAISGGFIEIAGNFYAALNAPEKHDSTRFILFIYGVIPVDEPVSMSGLEIIIIMTVIAN